MPPRGAGGDAAAAGAASPRQDSAPPGGCGREEAPSSPPWPWRLLARGGAPELATCSGSRAHGAAPPHDGASPCRRWGVGVAEPSSSRVVLRSPVERVSPTGPSAGPGAPPSDAVTCIPSIGSQDHASGRCRPCTFARTAAGCRYGASCKRCHLLSGGAGRSRPVPPGGRGLSAPTHRGPHPRRARVHDGALGSRRRRGRAGSRQRRWVAGSSAAAPQAKSSRHVSGLFAVRGCHRLRVGHGESSVCPGPRRRSGSLAFLAKPTARRGSAEPPPPTGPRHILAVVCALFDPRPVALARARVCGGGGLLF